MFFADVVSFKSVCTLRIEQRLPYSMSDVSEKFCHSLLPLTLARRRGINNIYRPSKTPLNRSQQLPAPHKRLIDEIKQN